jgi:protoheme IX farnesyltransferase
MKSEAVILAGYRTRTMDFVALAKPRLNFLVVASAMAGYAMAGMEGLGVTRLFGTLAGTGLVAGGASALNQLLERDTDALMRRTRMRPLPDGRVQPGEALVFGCALAAIGLMILTATANVLAAAVALATVLVYVAVYTPLKRRTSLATVVGAVPGALPPIIGWAAARGTLSVQAWTLFGIVFLWQLPHFLAIAWMFRDDYTRAGFPLLPVIEPDGRSTARQAVVYAAALLPLSLAPTLFGLSGRLYFAAAMALGLAFIWLTVRFARTRSTQDARALFFGSITYLPLIWMMMIVDRL